MTRIVRNDAPRHRTVNLVSDEESASSNSSSSESSSGSDEEAQATPSPLSDFIEEDDDPQPLPPKSSASSWEPAKRCRKRVRTLRKKPRLDKADADEEDSASTSSTSSEGIPTPDVQADADDEEEPVEKPSPSLTLSKRRRPPRRAAAPRCFLDALNKFVEPMSKQAKEYSKRSIHDMWHDDSDREYCGDASGDSREDSGEASDDSSIAYVAPQPEAEEEGDDRAEEEMEQAFGEGEQHESNNTESLPLNGRQMRGADFYHNGVYHVVDSDDEDAAMVGNPEVALVPQSPPIQRCPSLLDLVDTDEEVCVSAVVEEKQNAPNDGIEAVASLPHCPSVELQNPTATSNQQKRETEVVDLCSDEEYATPTFEEEPDDSNNGTIRDESKCTKNEARDRGKRSKEQEEQRRAQEILQDGDKDQRVSFQGSTSFVGKEDSDSARKMKSLSYSHCDDSSPPSTTADRGMAHERNALLAATLARTQSPQADSKEHVIANSMQSNAMVKSESDQNVKPRDKGNDDTKVGKERKPSQNDVKDRISKSEDEKSAWLEFLKAEARDIHRAFTAEQPARKFKCASIDVLFIRQVIGELGRLMDLKVRAEKGQGRRCLTLERYPSRPVCGGSEQDIEQAAERLFYEALADLTGKRWKKEPNVAKKLEESCEKKTRSGCRKGDDTTEKNEDEKRYSTTPRSSRSRKGKSGRRPCKDENRVPPRTQQNKRKRRQESDQHGSTEGHSHARKRRRRR